MRAQQSQQGGQKPNIIFILADNLGYGELGCYGGGILRGAPTPRIDRLAAEGTRLLNFNVEPQCTPSRSAFITGRHPIRSGTYSVPIDGRPYGPVRWEVTLPDLLSSQGYATGIFGKWHLGDSEGRYPHDRGFDEWYGIPNSSDESFWPQQAGFDAKLAHLEQVMEGRRGEKARGIKVYDDNARREIDLELTTKTIDFMKRSVQAGRPFFAYVPFTLVHAPTEPSKQFAGKTGRGDWADVLAQMDWSVGQILDAVAEMGVQDNTVFVFTSDNGPEETYPWRGWAGPWSGSYFTAMEGSLRTPFIIRWPGRVPEGRVSNEIVHIADLFTTLARIAGAEIPQDRPIDGLDQTSFLLGRQETSVREWFPVYVNNELFAVKWRNWKLHFVWQERMDDAPQRLGGGVKLFNLDITPQERPDESLPTGFTHGWVVHGIFAALTPFQQSLKEHPPIPMGAADPYRPGKSG
ncbi:arylsulfatase [Teichococcus coralli]|uniref:arylsulfatase n=1 Tax=Teichococcus coralli TaxID=2545983 RepID=UPI0019295266